MVPIRIPFQFLSQFKLIATNSSTAITAAANKPPYLGSKLLNAFSQAIGHKDYSALYNDSGAFGNGNLNKFALHLRLSQELPKFLPMFDKNSVVESLNKVINEMGIISANKFNPIPNVPSVYFGSAKHLTKADMSAILEILNQTVLDGNVFGNKPDKSSVVTHVKFDNAEIFYVSTSDTEAKLTDRMAFVCSTFNELKDVIKANILPDSLPDTIAFTMGIVHPDVGVNQVTIHSLPITPDVRPELIKYLVSKDDVSLDSIIADHSEIYLCGQKNILQYSTAQYQENCIERYFAEHPHRSHLQEAIGQCVGELVEFEYSIESIRMFSGSVYDKLNVQFIRSAFIDWLIRSNNLRSLK